VPIREGVIDYPLLGRPAREHYEILLLLLDDGDVERGGGASMGRRRYPPEKIGDLFFNHPNGVQAFLNEISYGQVSLAGQLVGWRSMGASPENSEGFVRDVDQYLALAEPYTKLSQFDLVYLIGRTRSTGTLQMGSPSISAFRTGRRPAEFAPEVARAFEPALHPEFDRIGISYLINSPMYLETGSGRFSSILPSRTWAHELLHALSLRGHDLSLDCRDVSVAGSCVFTPYGNPFSVMGASAFGNHPAAEAKLRLGWLDREQLPWIRESRDIGLCPLETQDDRPKGFVVPLDPPVQILSQATGKSALFDRVVVEYRAALGFDRRLEDLFLDPNPGASRLGSSGAEPLLGGEGLGENGLPSGVLVSLGYADRSIASTMLINPRSDAARQLFEAASGQALLERARQSLLPVGTRLIVRGTGISIDLRERTEDGGIQVAVRVPEDGTRRSE